MPAIHFAWGDLSPELPEFAPVPLPIGDTIAHVRSKSRVADHRPTTRTGIWECKPGRFSRYIRQAEFCHFLEGEARFTPEDGSTPLHIKAGDVVYFPANTMGEWEVLADSRKIYILFDEVDAG